ncbi:MAG: phenylalanine--tRNA ligase beta subunit-related protein [Chloroflexota bacterium]
MTEQRIDTMTIHLNIADEIFVEHPEVLIGVVVAHNIDNSADKEPKLEAMLREAEAALPAQMDSTPVSQHPHIAPWREAYRKFGAKPKKYQSSIENMTKRVLNGGQLGYINTLVALYNVVSLQHLLPIGGEDLDTVQGDVWLRVAGDDEPAVQMLGEREARPPYAREIIYADDVGAICRRWNWKEADRTKLTHETKNAFLVVEAIPPIGRDQVAAALSDLEILVRTCCRGDISSVILDTEQRSTILCE